MTDGGETARGVSSDSPAVTRARLGDILSLRRQIVHPRDRPKGQAIFVGLEHIESGTGRRNGHLDVEKSQLGGRKPVFRKGDIVYGYLRPYLNKVWIAEFDGLCSVDQYVYSVDSEVADAEYVAWFLRSPAFLDRAPISETPGQLPRIRLEEVASVEIDLPSLVVQRETAVNLHEQMAAVERARAAAEARLEAARALTGAVLHAAFDTPEAYRWPRRQLGDICQVVGGSTPASGVAEFWNGDFVWVTPTDLGRLDGRSIWSSERQVSREGYESCGTELVPAGTVVLSSRAPIGHLGVACVELCTNQGCKSFVPGPEVDSTFLYFALKRSVPKLRELGSGATFSEISKSIVEKFEIGLPPLEDQRRIVDFLDRQMAVVERSRSAAEGGFRALENLPAALLLRAFRGEL